MKPYSIIKFIAEKVPEYSWDKLSSKGKIPIPVEGEGYIDENGLRQGKFTKGKQVGHFVDDVKHGYFEEFDLFFTEKGNYVHGKREGEWVIYNRVHDFIYKSGTYKNGEKEGEWIEYNHQGKPVLIQTIKNGKLNGRFEQYNINGVLLRKGEFVNDLKQGIWHFYSYQGDKKFHEERRYKDGREVW